MDFLGGLPTVDARKPHRAPADTWREETGATTSMIAFLMKEVLSQFVEETPLFFASSTHQATKPIPYRSMDPYHCFGG